MTATAPPPSRARRQPPRSHRDGAATKRRIVDAAGRVVIRDGVGHLTIEGAAAEAGLSKGGVLYHFPSRDSLVAAMVDRIIEQFEEEIAVHLPDPASPESRAPGVFARAYVRATFDVAPAGEERLGAALLAASAAEPELLAPLQAAADGWQARMVDDGCDAVDATVIRMACDGVWLCDLFGLAPPTGARRAAVAAALESRTQVTS